MKIVYCLNNYSTGGGVERIISLKANNLVLTRDYEVFLISTEMENISSFYEFNPLVTLINLGINFNDDKNKPLFIKLICRLRKKIIYKKRLAHELSKIKADIVISTFWHEFSFLHKLPDGSKKLVEFHFTRFYKSFETKKISLSKKLYLYITHKLEAYTASKYDKFILLTERDRHLWGNLKNSVNINNMITTLSPNSSSLNRKTVIAVGRLTHQKGFDILIDIWSRLSGEYADWKLNIFGDGEDYEFLRDLTIKLGVTETVSLLPSTKLIYNEYLQSSIFAFSSRYEGVGMVLIEAMSCGLPPIAFDCECGPSELITSGENGFLIPVLDINSFVECLEKLMQSEELRIKMGHKSKESILNLKEEVIMGKWENLFEQMVDNN